MNLNSKKFGIKKSFDAWLILAISSLLGLGLVMLFSASQAYAELRGLSPFYFVYRQTLTMLLGGAIMLCLSYCPLRLIKTVGPLLLLCSLVALTLLLIPGMSREVNGSLRWLFIGPISLQVSEFVKLVMIIYMAGFLSRRSLEVREHFSGFFKPLVVVALISSLLLLEPDFGAACVITVTVMGMLFLGGAPFKRFLLLFSLTLTILGLLLSYSPYRMARMSAFLNPWADQFNTGYQLTQSLIAFGRGGWFGVGLGSSLQKLLYLPEPHTDFLFAVIAEELGLIGALMVLSLYILFVWRAFMIGFKALNLNEPFAGFMAFGIGLWIGVQTLINLGVNVGLLPTKGLTLPFMSWGGNSLVVCLIAVGVLLRIDFELRAPRLMKKMMIDNL